MGPIMQGQPRSGGPMIPRYSDHAANERTFLAWIRTAIAVMAFGFLIERFDLFLAAIRAEAKSHPVGDPGHRFASTAGLVFILLGVAMVAIAAVRFFRIGRDIDKSETVSSSGSVYDLVLAALLLLLGLSLFLYLGRLITPLE
jgi:putative membrane protein